jgi:cytoskeletal protein CcmA (bactofilin family)
MAEPRNSKGSAGGAGDRKTVIEEGTQFKGSLSSSCPIVVRGQLQGDVAAPSLTVSASGAVHGTVRVAEIESEGELAGEFDAERIQLSGTVKDKTVIRARSLEVKLGSSNGKMQVVFGECVLDVGEAPARAVADDDPSDHTSGGSSSRSRAEEVARAPVTAVALKTAEEPVAPPDGPGGEAGVEPGGALEKVASSG